MTVADGGKGEGEGKGQGWGRGERFLIFDLTL